MATVAQNFDLAYRHHQAGNLQQAEELYRQILSADPKHVDAWHFFGLIALKAGRHDLACDFIRNALILNPNYVEAHNNLGYCLWEQGKLEEAIACYFQALRLNPNLAGRIITWESPTEIRAGSTRQWPAFKQLFASNPITSRRTTIWD